MEELTIRNRRGGRNEGAGGGQDPTDSGGQGGAEEDGSKVKKANRTRHRGRPHSCGGSRVDRVKADGGDGRGEEMHVKAKSKGWGTGGKSESGTSRKGSMGAGGKGAQSKDQERAGGGAGRRSGAGGKGEGALGRDRVERARGGARRGGWQGAASTKEVSKGKAEVDVRRGGFSLDRRGGAGRRDGARDAKERNGWRSSSVGKNGAPRGNRLGFKKLEELSKKDPSVVAITLSSNRDLEEFLSETTMRKDLIELICLVLSRAFQSRVDRGSLQHLAGIIKDSGFFRAVLPLYLAGMESESNAVRRAQHPQHLENIMTVLSQVLSMFPASSINVGSVLQIQLQVAANSLKSSGVEIKPQVEESLDNLQGLLTHLKERSREGTLRSDKDTYALLPSGYYNPDEAQQDFRTIPIYPNPEEFHQETKPFLRPNLTSQPYTDTHLYLDTHFRLLREDFVRPLRDGVQQLLQNLNRMGNNINQLKRAQFDDIRIYFDTQLMVPKCTRTGLAYIVQFDSEPLQFVRWENSKRLIYGSLVCLSCDNFESFLFATVSDRDPKFLQKGLVQISFTEESRLKLAQIPKGQLFLMVETTAYFEAYRHVLEGLQEQQEDKLPFQRYIVQCSAEVQPPAYLQRQASYDLKAIAKPLYKGRMKPFNCLKVEAWPQKEQLGLDESQMKAIQLALTKELAIIQGPPGTGKTYVGLKIAQALLTNQDLWRGRLGRTPMLVVCYTNHALDQFLEGIHKFLKAGIVRVGGRSNSEVLKHFNLRELSHAPEFRRSLPQHLRAAHTELYDELCQDESEIQHLSKSLECTLKGILHEAPLQRFMSDIHWESLHHPPTEDGFEMFIASPKSSLILEWFGYGSTVFLQRETENAHPNEDEMMELEEEALIEIEEEADLIQAERIIDDYTGPRNGRDGWQYQEEDIREIEEGMLAVNLDDTEIETKQSEGEEGKWQMTREQKKRMKSRIKKELAKSSVMSEDEEAVVVNIWTLSLEDRWRLYRLWVARYRADFTTKVAECEQAYQNTVDRLAEIKQHEDQLLLQRATVIGMTTTGAAKYRRVLQRVSPCLVIVEEAAEVLEAHTITTLSEACQHLILIGDHQQLRPSATVYELAKNFNLEMSMFERLVKMGLPFVRLDYQHRMRPDIARLLTPHIYSELENHPSVLKYENIKGVKTNLFFVEHNHMEEGLRDGKSHRNKHEAEFIVALCRYLLFQGYEPAQITILTTYTGQFLCLRQLMPANPFSGVKVHVVDKYQGEENDIVLLSLVRSNPQGKVGFLNIPNRVCVALSRAKKGLYCIGDSTMLKQVKLWSNIFCTLREKDQIGKALTLCCQNHPDREALVRCADDFKQAPEGGCTEPCEFRLDCGHVCASVCHPYDPEHKEYKCTKKCQRKLCDLGHKCPFLCYKECPEKCPVKVEKIIPKCQHTQMVPCHQDPETFMCRVPCQKLLDCGHPCDLLCGQLCTTKCKVEVTLLLQCGHSQKGACFYTTETEGPKCNTPCEHQLKCGHPCGGTCGSCYQGQFHSLCVHQCERLLICSHKCREPCTPNCPPCRRQCENRCVHSKCMKPCGEPCAPCIEPCIWQCPHQSCTKLCHEPCDRPPCTQPCDKLLGCGHPCIGLCGDKCPNKCRVCDREEVTDILFGTEDDPEAYFIQLEDCGHLIEHSAMDTYMEMDENQQAEGEEVAIKLKECPRCRTPIRKNLRYGSRVNASLAQIEMVKEKINGFQADNEKRKEILRNKSENLFTDNHPFHLTLKHSLKKAYLSANDLWILENKISCLEETVKLRKIHGEKLWLSLGFTLEKRLDEFERWITNRHQKFTEQQAYDVQRELQRITLLTELSVRCHIADERAQSDKIQSEVQTLRKLLEKSTQFTEQDQQSVKEVMKELDKKVPPSGLGISEDERKMILSAMQMRPGHWYKCPNGHVYVITECGGAMETRHCPDCDATIGGASHTLAAGNQVASEMDGAQHAAWSEANNLQNFGQLDF
ncbi:uncharacterized protein V6R79_016437 [Siganus canaliculatus]